jgi:hypothetical protein
MIQEAAKGLTITHAKFPRVCRVPEADARFSSRLSFYRVYLHVSGNISRPRPGNGPLKGLYYPD